VEVKRFLIAKGADRQLVYFWYETQGRVIAKNHELILYRFWDRAMKARTDGSLVRITIPIGSGGEAEAEGVFQRFIEKFVPRLPTYLPS
jgi:EpsI family protein